MNEYIKSDCYRYFGKTDIRTMIYGFLSNPLFRFQVAFRLCSSGGGTYILGRVLWFFNQTKRIIQIQRGTRIGYGLKIGHLAPIIINPKTIIGDNFSIAHFVTIGSNHGTPASIGDSVYIGPNTSIVEDVNIGNLVTIGAGSVVTKDIPNNATAAGNYAKVISYKQPGRYIGNPWKTN